MTEVQEILKQVNSAQGLTGWALLYSKEQRIPGSTQYKIRRYQAQDAWGAEDMETTEDYEASGLPTVLPL